MARAEVPSPASREGGPRRILVIQTAFLGDIVLTTSFLANLRRLEPAAEIRLLTTAGGARLLSPNSEGVTLVPYDKRGQEAGLRGFLRKGRELRAFAPDLVFCLHRSLRSVLLARLAGGESWGFREAAGSFLLRHLAERPAGSYEAEKNHALLLAWAGTRAEGLPLFPHLSCSETDEQEAARALENLEGEFVALAPSSVWATKRWPAERFGALAHAFWRSHGLRTVVVGGSEAADREAARGLMAAYEALAGPGEPAPLDLSGKTSLGGLKSVLSKAKIVVANDSAPLHVAVAVGSKVLGIFGPTTKDLGFFPLAPEGRSAVVELGGLDCRPCGKHGHQQCPRGHFRCMLELAPESVFAEAEKLLCHP